MARARWLIVLLVCACSDKDEPTADPPAAAPPKENGSKPDGNGPPERVRFEHILISFKGAADEADDTVPNLRANVRKIGSLRPKEEARRLAYMIKERVDSGVDFDALKQRYSDDRNRQTDEALGPYGLVEPGQPRGRDDMPRSHYSKRAADLLFSMKVGEVRVADHHPRDCPFGWEVLKRIE